MPNLHSLRRCLLASQLKLKKKDPKFNQFCIYSWFRGVKRPPERLDGFTLFYFIGLHQAWSWHIPLRKARSENRLQVEGPAPGPSRASLSLPAPPPRPVPVGRARCG